MFALEMRLWLCRGHFAASRRRLGLFILAVSTSLFVSGVAWMLYLALEPWVRRRWPQTIISWSRLLSGQVRDPVVGRDILVRGDAGRGLDSDLSDSLHPDDAHGSRARLGSTEFLMGGRTALGAWLSSMATVDS